MYETMWEQIEVAINQTLSEMDDWVENLIDLETEE